MYVGRHCLEFYFDGVLYMYLRYSWKLSSSQILLTLQYVLGFARVAFSLNFFHEAVLVLKKKGGGVFDNKMAFASVLNLKKWIIRWTFFRNIQQIICSIFFYIYELCVNKHWAAWNFQTLIEVANVLNVICHFFKITIVDVFNLIFFLSNHVRCHDTKVDHLDGNERILYIYLYNW